MSMFVTTNRIKQITLAAGLTIALFPATSHSQEYEWLSTKGPSSGNVVSILELDDGTVLAGTERKGLFLRNDEDEQWTNVPFRIFNEDQVRALAGYDGALLAGTGRSGIYRSTDEGLTWERFNEGLSSTLIYDFLVSRQNELYVATGRGIYRLSPSNKWEDLGGPLLLDVRTIVEISDGGIMIGTFNAGKLLTSDLGESWEQVDDIGPVRSLAVGPSGEVIAGIWGLPTIQRSDDDGKTWRPVSNGLVATRLWSVTIDHEGVMYAGSATRGISHSADGGETWLVNSVPHSTVTSLSTAPDGAVWGGTSVGAFRTADHGQTWDLEGIPLGRVRALFSNGTRVVAGNDAGGIYYSDDLGATWIRTNAETDAVYEIERKIDGALYAATRGKVYRSDDEGTTWTSVWNTYLWIFSTAIDSKGTVFAGTESGIYRQDPDSSWKRVSPAGQRVFSIAVDSEDIAYAGIEHEAMLRSTDGGTTWEQVADQFLVTNECLCSILVMADGQLAAAALLAGGVWLSADRGETWETMEGISEEIVTDISLSAEGEFVAGGSTGRVFFFDSDTEAWIPAGPIAPDRIRSITLVRTNPDIVLLVGTEETGVYTRVALHPNAVEEHPEVGTSFSLSVYPNPTSAFAIIEWKSDQSGDIELQLVDPLGRIVRSRSLFSARGQESIRLDFSTVPSGLYQFRARHVSGWSSARPIVIVH